MIKKHEYRSLVFYEAKSYDFCDSYSRGKATKPVTNNQTLV